MKKNFLAGATGVFLAGGTVFAAAPAGIENGGFESCYRTAGKISKDVGFGIWKQGKNNLVPNKWNLNVSSPGNLEILEEGAAEGKRALKITADVDVKHKRGAHLYVFANGLTEGKKYRITAKVRNGSADIGFYEYKLDKSMKAVVVCKVENAGPDEWVEVNGEYQVPANFKNAYLAIMVPWEKSIEIDDVKLVEIPENKE